MPHARPFALRAPFSSQPQPRPLLASRYAKTDPLRRLFGLLLLIEPLPAPAALVLLRAWMYPPHFTAEPAIPTTRERQRLPLDVLPDLPAWRLDMMAWIELQVGRRIVEVSRTAITREERNHLLREQGVYLAHIYHALVSQLGEAAAQEVFAQHVQAV